MLLNSKNKTFVIYIVSILESIKIKIYPLQKTLIALLKTEKINIYRKYFDFANIFSSNDVVELLEYTNIKDYLIDLIDDKQLLYSLIYSIKLVKLKILKTYVKIMLASGFFQLFKFSATISILFV